MFISLRELDSRLQIELSRNFSTKQCRSVFPQNLPICQICLQKQCDLGSGGITAATERSLLGSAIPPRCAVSCSTHPAARPPASPSTQEFGSCFAAPSAAPQDGSACTTAHRTGSRKCDSCSPSSSNVNSTVRSRDLTFDYCTAPAQQCSAQLKYLCATAQDVLGSNVELSGQI